MNWRQVLLYSFHSSTPLFVLLLILVNSIYNGCEAQLIKRHQKQLLQLDDTTEEIFKKRSCFDPWLAQPPTTQLLSGTFSGTSNKKSTFESSGQTDLCILMGPTSQKLINYLGHEEEHYDVRVVLNPSREEAVTLFLNWMTSYFLQQKTMVSHCTQNNNLLLLTLIECHPHLLKCVDWTAACLLLIKIAFVIHCSIS